MFTPRDRTLSASTSISLKTRIMAAASLWMVPVISTTVDKDDFAYTILRSEVYMASPVLVVGPSTPFTDSSIP
jgi:hypothetical protein